MEPSVDLAVVGAGAAGLMAAIQAGRAVLGADNPGESGGDATRSASRPAGPRGLRIVVLDGARRPGAKILVAGGGRCNVTHDRVDESAYAGSSRAAIRKVLRRFDVPETVEFFRGLGVELKREETGKLFPTTDDAHTVLNALFRAAAEAGVDLVYPWRVESIERTEAGFRLVRAAAPEVDPRYSGPSLLARRVILATGGRSLPKTGSDGHGYALARSLGHTVTPTFPALVPLTLPDGHFLRGLAGITLPATLEVRSATGKRLVAFTDSTLLTHFGLSGPSVLDISRYFLGAVAEPGGGADGPRLFINFVPALAPEGLDARLAEAGRREGRLTALRFMTSLVPERLARALCERAGVEPGTPLAALAREKRRALADAATALELPITGSRGFNYAEVTAGGVPLGEVHLETMESRVCPGLHLCGEVLDVDGRIGGYNFQWAWASGFVAGTSAALALEQPSISAAGTTRLPGR